LLNYSSAVANPATSSAYSVSSVDNALRLILMLDNAGPARLSTLADELGVARSTAHRLLATLMQRGFAVQSSDKLYGPGPALASGRPRKISPAQLRIVSRPSLEALSLQLQETVHLMIRRGRSVVFLDSVESKRALRVGSRRGAVMPAHLTSGGQALLSFLTPDELTGLYSRIPAGERFSGTDLRALRRSLSETRRRGYGLNLGGTEPGLTAVGRCVIGPDSSPIAAITISAPSARLSKVRIPEVADALREAVGRLESELSS
jgi:IclR family acetate operon transcriptional repressor